MQYGFGSGSMFLTPAGANPTPVKFGALQDVSVDFGFNVKELYGQYQYPLSVARSIAKVQGKAKAAQISGSLWSQFFFNQSAVTGEVRSALDESGTPAANTITVANAANFLADLGVYYASTGLPLQRVASAPAAGQYSVNVATGVYTFNATDTGAMKLNYQYTVAASGKKIVVANQLIGQASTFSVQFSATYNSQQLNITLNACISNKLAFATKLEDFIVPEFDFQAFADSANNICTISMNE